MMKGVQQNGLYVLLGKTSIGSINASLVHLMRRLMYGMLD